MQEIAPLLEIDFRSLFISVVTIMIAFVALKKIFTDVFGWLGLETKYMREKREQKEEIQQTQKDIENLQEEHNQDLQHINDRFDGFDMKFEGISNQLKDMAKVSDDKSKLSNAMLTGLGHDRIVALGRQYIERGYITIEEYKTLREYLFEPYAALGGDGVADKIMQEVDKLEIKEQ